MNSRLLRHVVLFAFTEETTPQQITSIENAFLALKDTISVVSELEWGTNVSPEGLNQGFSHCFFLTFESEAARDEYLPHPQHQAFGALLRPHLDSVCVVDYWTKN